MQFSSVKDIHIVVQPTYRTLLAKLKLSSFIKLHLTTTSHSPLPPPLGTTILLSVFMNLNSQATSYKWDLTVLVSL